MRSIISSVLVFVILIGMILLSQAFFIVYEGQQAIITQFGRIVGQPYREAGLYWKIPFIQQVHIYEKRILEWDGDPDVIPTLDKKYIFIDSTARWRIVDPVKFFMTLRTMRNAVDRLNDIIDSAVRDQVSQFLLIEIVRSTNHIPELPEEQLVSLSEEVRRRIEVGHDRIVERILKEVQRQVEALDYGIEVLDVRIKNMNYESEDVRRAVYQRMIAERKRIAALYISEGRGEKAKIEGQMEKELRQIRSEAYRTAQEIRGKADAEATRIYAEAFSQDPEFFYFLRSLEAYSEIMQGNHTLILTTDSPIYRYLKSIQRTSRP